jgi:hypothetical protein
MTVAQLNVGSDIRTPKWLWFGLLTIFALSLIFGLVVQPSVDLYWRMYIAKGLLKGMVLYKDMVETNPPLWFWAAIPAAYLGGIKAMVVLNTCLGLIQVMLFFKLARLTTPMKDACLLTLSFAIGLMLINIDEIGQREQAFLAACVVWSALLAARSERKKVSIPLLLMAILFCSYGFALKHYFVLFPLAAEFLLLNYLKRAWSPFRLENFCLSAMACTYITSIFFLVPNYLTEIRELMSLTYSYFATYHELNLAQRTLRILVDCKVFNVAACVFLLRRKENSHLIGFVFLALSIALVVVVVQQKGFHYHYFAVTGLSTVLILSYTPRAINACSTSFRSVFPNVKPSPQNQLLRHQAEMATSGSLEVQQGIEIVIDRLKFWGNFGVLALVLLFVAQVALKFGADVRTRGERVLPYLEETVQQEPPESQIAILAVGPQFSFLPLAREKRAHWSRHHCLWMMHGLSVPRTKIIEEQRRLKLRSKMLAEFTQDVMCRPPSVLVGEVSRFEYPSLLHFDSIAFLMEDQEFAAWLDRYYQPVLAPNRFPTWRLKAEMPPRPENCATWVAFAPRAQ